MNKSAPANTTKTNDNKTKIFVGLVLLSLSFVGVVVIFYLLLNVSKEKGRQLDSFKEQVVSLNAQGAVAKRKAEEMEDRLGKSVYLNNLVTEAEKNYDVKEKNRREGALWIDRGSGVMYVTLGAINGLTAGSRVTIIDGDKRVGYVRVETPLDVISYVQPINQAMADYNKDYYRAVIEP